MSKARYDSQQLNDMVLQMMETELGGEQVYRTALTCAVNPDLKEEWEGYLQETLTHQDVVRSLCDTLGLDPDTQSPTRRVVKHIGESLVKAMQLAKQGGDPAAAQQHFDQLAKCTAVYLRLFHSGTPILKLAVAA